MNAQMRKSLRASADREKEEKKRRKRAKLARLPNTPNGAIDTGVATLCTRPTVRYADVGGIEAVLQQVRELVEWPLLKPELYQHLGVQPPRGVLLHGPPGCGKTMLANAIAGDTGVNFLRVAATELVSGMSGESEKNLRALFDKAKASAPCLVFIDEIDSIAPKRESTGRQMEQRIVAQLLACLDDLSRCNNATEGTKDEEKSEDEDRMNDDSESVAEEAEETTPVAPAVMVVAATSRIDALDPALRRAGRFDKEIALGIPDERARARILKVLTRSMRLSGQDFDFGYVARRTAGFVGADLSALANEAAQIAIRRCFTALAPNKCDGGSSVDSDSTTATSQGTVSAVVEADANGNADAESAAFDRVRDPTQLSSQELSNLSVELSDFEQALAHVQPSAKREGFATTPNVSWDDVGALSTLRQEMFRSIVMPIVKRDLYKRMGLRASSGVLLYGPPGCGKTLLAKAVANESKASFVSVKGPELLNKYVGESERAVRSVFARARASAPCIVFFDELDALAPKRGSSGESSSVSERVVNQLLTEMDGLDDRGQVFVVGATNRPDIIDDAIKRPGRLDKLLFVSLPSAEGREDILRTHMRKVPTAVDVDVAAIARDPLAEGFSGADCAALVRQAAQLAVAESLRDVCASNEAMRQFVEQAGRSEESNEDEQVHHRHFLDAFSHVRPSVSQKTARLYERMRSSFEQRHVKKEEKSSAKSTFSSSNVAGSASSDAGKSTSTGSHVAAN
ncbi:MAG: hypothetical protein MHM6MM_001828 [Cercozoa sp. M6MM]